MPLAKGADVVCIFVNAECNAAVIDELVSYGVKLIALRCAGFNNVDLKAAKDRIDVVRVPAYSPHAVAEYAGGAHALAQPQDLPRRQPHARR